MKKENDKTCQILTILFIMQYLYKMSVLAKVIFIFLIFF